MPERLRTLAARLAAAVPGSSRVWRRTLAFTGLFIVLLGAAGYFWLPGFLKDQLETQLTAQLNRQVSVDTIEITPHRLSVHLRGLRIAERAAPGGPPASLPLLALATADINFSGASIFRLAPIISALRINGLEIHLARAANGRLSIADLIDAARAKPPAPPDARPVNFSVSNIELSGSRFRFTDQLKNAVQDISDIRIGIPFIANFEASEETWVQPHFSARINGDPIRIDGEVRPFADVREASLRIVLNRVDLTALEEYAGLPTGLDLRSGNLDADLRLVFSQQRVPETAAPRLRIDGQVALHDVALLNATTRTPHVVELDAVRVMTRDLEPLAAKPIQLALDLQGLRIARADAKSAAITLAAGRIDQVTIDTAARTLQVAATTLDTLGVDLRRERNGELDLSALFAPSRVARADRRPPPPAPDTGNAGWQGTIASVALQNASVRFEDRSLPRPVPLVVAPIDATLTGIDLGGKRPLSLTLEATVNQSGRLAGTGSVAWQPLDLDLSIDARGIELVALQGWSGGRIQALLTRGAASFKGALRAHGTPLVVSVRGDGELAGFNVLDRKSASDLLRWRQLAVSGLQFTSAPLDVRLQHLALTDFFADVRLSPEGKLNLGELFAPPSTSASAPAAHSATAAPTTAADTAQTPPAAEAEPALPVRIARISLTRGAINFDDRFVRPNYRARLTGLSGTIGPLAPGSPGDIAIKGAVDGAAPLDIQGKLDPFGKPLFLDIAASAKGIDLPGLTPYSGKYVGYAIDKGKLSVDVRYHIEQGELRADNNIFLDQLTFGDKVDSPDALNVPVNLAVALLKNPRGEIDIHLPISGSLNDPEFSIGGIIVKVLVNLVVKAVTSPFALLGSLFGADQDLSTVAFEPGRARLAPDMEGRLQALSKAMAERPGLKLEVTGLAIPETDREALRRAQLDRLVRAQKAAAAAQRGQAAGSLREVDVSAEEYPRYLAAVYAEADIDKPRNTLGFARNLPVADMERLLLASQPAGDDALRQLAERRATLVRNWLLEQGGVPAERIFVLAPRVQTASSEAPGGQVVFSLR